MDSSVSQEILGPLPVEILENIFLYLTETADLRNVAQCNRAWREAANRDKLWRSVCRAKGWEHYGTIADDLSKETAFSGDTVYTFPFQSVVTQSEWPGLASTCKWKEIYMKALHLEERWRFQEYNVVSLKFGSPNDLAQNDRPAMVYNLAGEGNYFAGGISNGTLRIWDASNGQCRHIIQVDVSNGRQALKMKNGVVAVGCTDGKIRTYSAQTGEQLHVSLSRHRRPVSQLFLDGEIIVSFARWPEWGTGLRVFEDNEIRVWSSVDGACRFVFQSSSQGTKLLSWDYLDNTVAGAYSDKTIRLWDAGNGTLLRTIVADVSVLNTCLLGDGIVITGGMNVAKVWNSLTGECLKAIEVPGEDDTIFCEFTGEFLLALTVDLMNIKLYNLDGNSLGDTAFENDRFRLEPTYTRGNKLITSDRWGGDMTMDLWLMDHSGFHYIQELRAKMEYEESRPMYYVAWMSHTKLAFVEYFSEDDRNKRLEVPQVIVHHYW